jgi:hypothetical protein
VLIEPASLNDARLFSLETRVHEEEEIRIKEYEFLRDVVKKLLFALEKTNVSHLEQVIPKKEPPREQPSGPFLPTLLNTASHGHSLNDSKLKQGSISQSETSLPAPKADLLTLKRLHFLRNQLDAHNPRDTTQHLRT